MAKAKEWKWGYINREGEVVIPPDFDGASDFHEDLAAVKIDWARGYIDKTGRFVIPPQFEKAGDFHNGFANVTVDGQERIIDRTGNYIDVVLPEEVVTDPPAPDHELLSSYFEAGPYSENMARVQKTATGKWGYVDLAGKFVISPRFRQAGDFHEGLARILTQKEQ